jgi:hypothetical protein
MPRDFFERLAGRGLARRHGRGSQLHHERSLAMLAVLSTWEAVAAEQPTLDRMRASGARRPRRGCSCEISLAVATSRYQSLPVAAHSTRAPGADNDRGPCSADLKPQEWPAPSQLLAARHSVLLWGRFCPLAHEARGTANVNGFPARSVFIAFGSASTLPHFHSFLTRQSLLGAAY